MRHEFDDLDAVAGPTTSEPTRPVSVVRPSERVRELVEWFGVARLITSAFAVLVVCLGAWFLVRTPTPPPESSLPTASADPDVPPSTLPVPSTLDDRRIDAPGGEVVVHVAGAVEVPGVYELPDGSRVADAIEEAGGSVSEADTSRVNLAALLVDGSRIYLPATGEDPPAPIGQGDGVVDDGAGPTAPVDVNTADAVTLETLPGIGPTTAAAIVAERERHGPFTSVGDLERVAGIGPAKVAALTELVVT